MILEPNDRILVTGYGGFIGRRVVACLIERGFRNVVGLMRPSIIVSQANNTTTSQATSCLNVLHGNLLSRDDCLRITKDARLVYHLAAGRGEKSFPDSFLNSVVTTRNLLDACVEQQCLKRFVSISSFAVYDNRSKRPRPLLAEDCPFEKKPELRGQAYCFAKVRQDELVLQYAKKHQLPVVTIRPGWVYGPGNEAIHSRVGISAFGLFLHMGGGNILPLSYVDNCAEAIVLAGLVNGIEGEVFNVVDDDLPTSCQFLRAYKRFVRRFPSVYLPHSLSYLFCWFWEKYSSWSEGQLPPVYGLGTWHANWKKTSYSNDKLKNRLGWTQRVPTNEGLNRYFAACREKLNHA